MFTLNRDPDKPSTTENNWPDGPLTSNMVASNPVPCTDNTLDEPVATKGPIAWPETEPVNDPVYEPVYEEADTLPAICNVANVGVIPLGRAIIQGIP